MVRHGLPPRDDGQGFMLLGEFTVCTFASGQDQGRYAGLYPRWCRQPPLISIYQHWLMKARCGIGRIIFMSEKLFQEQDK